LVGGSEYLLGGEATTEDLGFTRMVAVTAWRVRVILPSEAAPVLGSLSAYLWPDY
jgi:hypothetical protein